MKLQVLLFLGLQPSCNFLIKLSYFTSGLGENWMNEMYEINKGY